MVEVMPDDLCPTQIWVKTHEPFLIQVSECFEFFDCECFHNVSHVYSSKTCLNVMSFALKRFIRSNAYTALINRALQIVPDLVV